MKDTFYKYLLIVILIIQLSLIGYLSIYFLLNDNFSYNQIKIQGNSLLSDEQYLKLLKEQLNFKNYSLYQIKSTLEEHPYVINADVILNYNRIIEIKLEEKQINAVIIENTEPYLVTSKYELIRQIPQTLLPSIPTLLIRENVENIRGNNENLIISFKIIDVIKKVNKEYFDKLETINLLDEQTIILLLRNNNAVVMLNRNNYVKEVITLIEFLNSEYFELLDENSRYIDIRYNNQIIIG